MRDLSVPIASPRSHRGRRKAAVFLATLGPEVSSSIFQHLRDDEVEELTAEIARLESIDLEERDDVLMEAGDRVAAGRRAGLQDSRYEMELSVRSYDPLQLIHASERLPEMTSKGLLRRVRGTPPERLHLLVRHAPAQTIALILAHLEPQDASKVLGNLSVAIQSEIAERIAVLDRIDPELIRGAGRMLDAVEPSE